MNRINRVTSILIQLQSKKIIPAKEIAQRFNISLRTVYRDIRTLEEAGIPIGSEAGKGYFLVEGFLLPPVMFTAAEVGALITAGKFLNCHGDESFIKDFDSAMYKIRYIAPSCGWLPPSISLYHTRSAIVEIFDFGAVFLLCGYTGEGSKMCHNGLSSSMDYSNRMTGLYGICSPAM